MGASLNKDIKYFNTYLILYMLVVFLNVAKASNIGIATKLATLSNGLSFIIIIIGIILMTFELNTDEDVRLGQSSLIFNTLFIGSFILIILFLFGLLFKIKLVPLSAILLLSMCFNVRYLNLKLFVKCSILFTVIPALVTIFMNLLGIIPSSSSISSALGFAKGNSLGFAHPNVTGDIIINIITVLFIYLDYCIHSHRSHLKEIVLAIIGSSFVISFCLYKITDCRTLILFEIITLILFFISKSHIICSYIYKFFIFLIIFIPIITIYWDYNYYNSSSFYATIDKLASHRISMQNQILAYYPIKFIRSMANTRRISMTLNGSMTAMDNSYLSIVETSGLLGLLILILLVSIIFLLSIHIKSYILSALIISLVICGCVDSSLFENCLYIPLLYICTRYYFCTTDDI